MRRGELTVEPLEVDLNGTFWCKLDPICKSFGPGVEKEDGEPNQFSGPTSTLPFDQVKGATKNGPCISSPSIFRKVLPADRGASTTELKPIDWSTDFLQQARIVSFKNQLARSNFLDDVGVERADTSNYFIPFRHGLS